MRRIPAKKSLPVLLLTAIAAGTALYIHHANTALTVRAYTLYCPDLPEAFEGYTIVQLSDLHSHSYGKGQEDLLALVREQNPDIIVLTGDMTDGRRRNTEPVLTLYRALPAIAPCYSVWGNHEWYLTESEHAALSDALETAGVVDLNGAGVILSRGNESMLLAGLDDPSHLLWDSQLRGIRWKEAMLELYAQELDGLDAPAGAELAQMSVLLCHNPLPAELATGRGWDVVLSGHTHGGQIGLPGNRGLLSPDGGLFNRAAGALRMNGGWSVISRGMGNSVLPVRIADPLELVVVTLTAEPPS
jgi:predicted MPP superfamily phosphohydrolase